MPTDFWESLRLGFTQLRADCAIDPPLKPAGRLTAIWTAQLAPGQWRLDYSNAKDGYGVAKRFEWHAQSAAARLDFDENGQKAVWFWLDRVRRDAPESHIRAMNSVGLDGIEQLFSYEILDICGLSAEYCRKCAADEMISGVANAQGPDDLLPDSGPIGSPLERATQIAREAARAFDGTDLNQFGVTAKAMIDASGQAFAGISTEQITSGSGLFNLGQEKPIALNPEELEMFARDLDRTQRAVVESFATVGSRARAEGLVSHSDSPPAQNSAPEAAVIPKGPPDAARPPATMPPATKKTNATQRRLSARLKKLKAKSNLPWRTIAKESGVSYRWLLDIQSGRTPSADMRKTIRDYFSRVLERPIRF